ncbi:hypothetical protein FXO37_14696 [Capsicum annuum]|nr:hypothetical protein FXO37_14696 [Capsicum annuum]
MWKYRSGECIGFGKRFQTIFSQIGESLSELNKKKVAHGNVEKGIMLTRDKSIRMCNFILPSELSKKRKNEDVRPIPDEKRATEIEKDIQDFIKLMIKAAENDPRKYTLVSKDIEFLKFIARVRHLIMVVVPLSSGLSLASDYGCGSSEFRFESGI